MDLHLAGKTALVSGSTAGIGLAIAKVLAAEGAAVVVNGRTAGRVAGAVEAVRAAAGGGGGGSEVRGVVADLGTAEGVGRVVAEVPRVDILVNNVGIFEVRPFFELTDADWQRAFDVNVMSGVRLSRAYFGRMLEANWGRVIFISSESGVQIPAEMIQYGMSKTAQVAVARGMAELTAGTGVTVNSVLVGPTKSEGVATFVANMAAASKVGEAAFEADFFKTVRPTSLIKRFLDVDEVARVVAYLASSAASAINGAAVRAEGGLLKGAL